MARQLRIPKGAVEGIFFSDQTLGIKITVLKHPRMASGDVACADTFGAQQYVPLKEMTIDLPSSRPRRDRPMVAMPPESIRHP